MTDLLTILRTFFSVTKGTIDMVRSLHAPAALAFAQESSLDQLAARHFDGIAKVSERIRVSGTLVEFVLSPNHILYSPVAAESVQEKIVGYVPSPLSADGFAREASMTLNFSTLSPPAVAFPVLELAHGERVSLAWLYPGVLGSLILPGKEAPDAKSSPESASDILDVPASSRPVLCIMPPDGSGTRFLNQVIEVKTMGRASVDDVVFRLFDQLPPLQRSILSNTLRPLDAKCSAFALDLRSADIKIIEPLKSLPAMIAVEGLVTASQALTPEQVNAIVDAVPDRRGLHALRGAKVGEGQTMSILSNGEIRWFFDPADYRIAAFLQVDLVDRENYAQQVSKLAGHWQSWQRAARNGVSRLGPAQIKATPVRVWDPKRAATFHPNGAALPGEVGEQLSSADPSMRAAIDWLKVAAH